MKCPKCGTEIRDGYMYCPKCGEEVIMVPDFEIELEEGIEQTISEVAEMIAVSVEDIDESDTAKEPDEVNLTEPIEEIVDTPVKDNIRKTGTRILIAAAVVLGLVFVFGVYKLVTFVNDYYSYDKQFAKEMSEYDAGEYEAAVKTGKHVISLNPRDERPRFILADSYFALQKYDESIAVLNDLLKEYPQDKTIYERLLTLYEIEGDTESILTLSKMSSDPGILKLFDGYSSGSVDFSLESGTYEGPKEISITTSEGGTVYYTLDGSKPDTSSLVYEKPIELAEGETVITAVCVNGKGVMSEPVSRTYTINTAVLETPNLITAPGDYSTPELIRLTDPVNGTIYYTTDGTDPNEGSTLYEPPLLMPLGKSEYRFVIINNLGEAGDIITARYVLKINGVFDAEYAKNAVQLNLIAHGHAVMDHEFIAKYGYSHDGRNYYIVEEYANSGGKKQKQNTLYAVDSQTGEVFTINRNTDKKDYDFGIVS